MADNSTMNVTVAMAKARCARFMPMPSKATVGSGWIVTAPMAVKCRTQIAAASRAPPYTIASVPDRARKASIAVAAMAQPRIQEAVTRVTSHAMVPGMTRAVMPTKCIDPMAKPIRMPPKAVHQRLLPVATANPAAARAMAISREPIVATGSYCVGKAPL